MDAYLLAASHRASTVPLAGTYELLSQLVIVRAVETRLKFGRLLNNMTEYNIAKYCYYYTVIG